MRSQTALCIDAGYLIAAAATRVTGSSLRRAVSVDYPTLLGGLLDLVRSASGLPLLRAYWYDAARDGAALPEHDEVALTPHVKLRLGRIGVNGEQKGVDIRIGLDMVGHARGSSVDVIYLLSGDDDLTEAVEEAQAEGVEVVVLAVPDRHGQPHGVSRHLLRAADELLLVPDALLDRAVNAAGQPRSDLPSRSAVPPALSSPAAAPASATPTPADAARAATARPQVAESAAPRPADVNAAVIRDVVRRTFEAWSATASEEQQTWLRQDRPTIPRELDRALLVDLSSALAQFDLNDNTRVRLRDEFWLQFDGRTGSNTTS